MKPLELGSEQRHSQQGKELMVRHPTGVREEKACFISIATTCWTTRTMELEFRICSQCRDRRGCIYIRRPHSLVPYQPYLVVGDPMIETRDLFVNHCSLSNGHRLTTNNVLLLVREIRQSDVNDSEKKYSRTFVLDV